MSLEYALDIRVGRISLDFPSVDDAIQASERLPLVWGDRVYPEIGGYGHEVAFPRSAMILVNAGTSRERMTEIAEAALRILRPARNQI